MMSGMDQLIRQTPSPLVRDAKAAQLASTANSANNVAFNPKPIKVGLGWCIVATHSLSGQQEHIIGFHGEAEAAGWLASNGCKAWLRTRGYSATPNVGIIVPAAI